MALMKKITSTTRNRNVYLPLSCIQILMNTQLLGLIAGACTTIAFLPQVIKTWKSRSAKDLSLSMFSIFCIGVTLWLIYGIMERDIPVIAANLATLMLASTLLFFKLRFKG
jgi:MtN3 and saliva related transmembrane protein